MGALHFDSRFLENHVAGTEVLHKRYFSVFQFSLHPIVGTLDGEPIGDLIADLVISVTTGPQMGIRNWAIGFDPHAFDLDTIEAIQAFQTQG